LPSSLSRLARSIVSCSGMTFLLIILHLFIRIPYAVLSRCSMRTGSSRTRTPVA
jgi:hypothetical protein